MNDFYKNRYLDAVGLMMDNLRRENGFVNKSLAIAEYISGEETNIDIFFVMGNVNTNPSLKQYYEIIFTSIKNPELWAAKDTQNNDLDLVDRSDFDTDMGLVVAPTVKVTKYADLKVSLRMLNKEEFLKKEVLNLEDIEEIVSLAKDNKEMIGFSNVKSR